MKTDCIIYIYYRIPSTCEIELCLESWRVGIYPMTYTVQECIEDFCDKAGWKFVSTRVNKTISRGRGGYFYFEYPFGLYYSDVVREISQDYNQSLLE